MNFWNRKVKELWGTEVELLRLDGELDLNFKAQVANGDDFILKVMRPGCDIALVEMQCQALSHIVDNMADAPVPEVIKTKSGELFEIVEDQHAKGCIVWALTFLSGFSYASFSPKTLELAYDLGSQAADLNLALRDFEHPNLSRDLPWDLMQAHWIGDHLNVIEEAGRSATIQSIFNEYSVNRDRAAKLPEVPIHNDINDYNVLVSGSLSETAKISGIIDFGDMCLAPRVCEIAIAGAYVVLNCANPEAELASFVAGYHSVSSLSEAEIDLIYPLLRMRLAVSLVTSTMVAIEKPDDPYVVISQAPAWQFLEETNINADLLNCRLRAACGLPISDSAIGIARYLDKQRYNFAPVLGVPLKNSPMISLSVAESTVPENPLEMTPEEAANTVDINETQVSIGFYKEARLIYTEGSFRHGEWNGSSRRTLHLGVDLFAKAGTRVCTPLAATVHVIEYREAVLDYGGLVILEHETPGGETFYTLYGHLCPGVQNTLEVGQTLVAGEAFALLSDETQNGGWAPHLHFQLSLLDGGIFGEWSAIIEPTDSYLWETVSPNPAPLLNLPDEKLLATTIAEPTVLANRQRDFAANLSLSYTQPAMFLRGWKHYLFDQWGQPYLDAYNNVPHVGHANPRIQAVVSSQLKRMNSNTRYLHPAQSAFANKITAKMPEQLSVCFFVNSGSEGNELALRLARAHTGGKDIVTPDHGYHGNTTGAIAISAYKFNAKGGVGQPSWVQLIDAPDVYQGKFREDDSASAEKYANQVDDAISRIKQRGGKLAGFIGEIYPSVGGQIIPPKTYFKRVFHKIREAGGVCIADEVQTGLGRLGKHYFAFEEQNITPDIVVLGKPIGNGHPLGVVVTTQEIADSFAQGPEFFSTFGGSTLSCIIGKEVLDIVDDDGLQENAAVVGARLLKGLKNLQNSNEHVGDVRGSGLFIGVELVSDKETRTPATKLANYIVNRLREKRILIGTEGPHYNVLKIRPPLTIEVDDVDKLLNALTEVLSETVAR